MTYYQLNTYKHPPNTHFANVKYLYHKQTLKNWCSPVIKVKVIKVIKGFGGNGIYISPYTHLRAHEKDSYPVCRLLLEKKKSQEQTP